MTFGSRLKQAMECGGFTQASLAKQAGLAQSMIWKLVSGNAKGTSKLISLSKALGVRPEWLGEGNGPMQEETKAESARPLTEPFFSVQVYDKEEPTNTWIPVPEMAVSVKVVGTPG